MGFGSLFVTENNEKHTWHREGDAFGQSIAELENNLWYRFIKKHPVTSHREVYI